MISNKKLTVLILGSGPGGLRAALDLADRFGKRPAVRILLVDKRPYHTIKATLSNTILSPEISEILSLPIREVIAKRPIEFIVDLVSKIDPINQLVELHQHGSIRYDYLVVALGGIPNDTILAGLHDYAHHFYSLEDSLNFRQIFRHHRSDKLHLIIGGGGINGTELAAALAHYIMRIKRAARISIIEQNSHLLSGFSRRVSATIERILTGLGIHIYTNESLKKITADHAILSSNHKIPYDFFLWTGGIKANPLVKNSGFCLDKDGRIIVNQALQARGFSRVYAVGDIIHFPVSKKRPLPQTAIQAIRQGRMIAENIARQLHDSPPEPFVPRVYPTFIALGETALLTYKGLLLQGKWLYSLQKWQELAYVSSLLPISLAWRITFFGHHGRKHSFSRTAPLAQ